MDGKRAGQSVTVAQLSGVEFGELELLRGYAVPRAQIPVTRTFDRALVGFGLTTQRFSALVLIARNPGRAQAELAAIMGIARTGQRLAGSAIQPILTPC